ncbi:MAG TPA: hypothetical protein VM925_27595 [Labilithrix sp.]|nr:hypothetical protein [Labilithrix sp.]
MLLRNMHSYGLVSGFVGTFRISFSHWLEKLEQVVASLFGPFPFTQKIFCAVLALGVTFLAVRARGADAPGETESTPPVVSAVRGACLVFALGAYSRRRRFSSQTISASSTSD